MIPSLKIAGDIPNLPRFGTPPPFPCSNPLDEAPSKETLQDILKEKQYKKQSLKELFKDLPLDPVLRKKELWRIHRLMYIRNYRYKKALEKAKKKRSFESTARSQAKRRRKESKETNGWAMVSAKYGVGNSLTFAEWVDYGFFDKYDPEKNKILRKDPSKRNRHLDNILLIEKLADDNNRQSKPRKRAPKARYKVLIDPRPDIPSTNRSYPLDWG